MWALLEFLQLINPQVVETTRPMQLFQEYHSSLHATLSFVVRLCHWGLFKEVIKQAPLRCFRVFHLHSIVAVAPEELSGLVPYVYTPRCRSHDSFLESNVPKVPPESSVKCAQWNIRVTDPSDSHWSLLEDKTEGFTTEFMRLSRVVTEDLSKRLCNHHKWVQKGALDLEAFMCKLASHPLLTKHFDEITVEVKRFKQTATMSLLLPLIHLDSASSDIA